VHVCRRWRQIVFESPHRLDLKIRCTSKTPVRKNLGIWPVFPIAIDFRFSVSDSMTGDAIAALEHTDRVEYLKLYITELQLETFAIVTSKPFPMLKHLILHLKDEPEPLLPDDFLGGSAPCLQIIRLSNIAFPALPTLLLSASSLVELQLRSLPVSGYISPVTMAICLATLPRLKTLAIQFQFAMFCPYEINPPPDSRAVLPALTSFEFTGTSMYLEDFVAYIDCPRLNQIVISYLIFGDNPQVAQLSRFFKRSISPPFRHAKIRFDSDACGVTFDLYCPTNSTTGWDDSHPAATIISCWQIDWHLFRMLSKFSVILSTVADLKFVGKFEACHLLSDVFNLKWLLFLHQLSSLQALYVPSPLAEGFGDALKFIKGEVIAKAFPFLDLICLEGQASSIDKFLSVRQLFGCPLTIVGTEAEFDQRLRLQSYDKI
jgi:hypothetical protein